MLGGGLDLGMVIYHLLSQVHAAAVAAFDLVWSSSFLSYEINDIDVYIQGEKPDVRDWGRTDPKYEEGFIPNLVSSTHERNVFRGLILR